MGEYVTLVQLLHNFINFSHAVTISGNWIFGSNYKKSLMLVK